MYNLKIIIMFSIKNNSEKEKNIKQIIMEILNHKILMIMVYSESCDFSISGVGSSWVLFS